MKLVKGLRITLGAILMLACINMALNVLTHPIKVRPVTIKVVDSVTKLPIGNIPVYYMISSYRDKMFVLFVIPRPDPEIVTEYNLARKYYTNRNGEVIIPENRILIGLNKRIYNEEIYINMYVKEFLRKDDNDIEKKYGIKNDMFQLSLFGPSLDPDYLINPIEEYNGGIIINTRRLTGTKKYTETRDIGFLRYAEGHLRYDSDQYVVSLERKGTHMVSTWVRP